MLTASDVKALAEKTWRSPVEFCRIFLPKWFPTPMPWLHRGILAVMTGRCDFLLDFGPEIWGNGRVGQWTQRDLEILIKNFRVRIDPRDKSSGMVSIFVPKRDLLGNIVGLTLHATASKAFIVPRGFSKTTLMNAANLIAIVFASKKFILYISEASGHAEKQLGTIKNQLLDNDLLRLVFGNLVPDRNDAKKWTDPYVELLNDVKVGAIGRNGQIRGMAKDADRPDRIVLDDVEDDESASSDTQRPKTKGWFMGVVMPALQDIIVDENDAPDIFMIGTLLHNEALLPSLEQDEDWTWVRFSALDLDGNPIWPLRMDETKLERTRKRFAAMGALHKFYLEYMSDGSFNQDAIFPQNKMLYLHKGLENFVLMAQACDPAISEDRRADFCAFAVVGIEQGGCCHVVDTYARVGMRPDEQVDKWFELHFRYMAARDLGLNRHGIEAIAYQRALISSIQARMHEESQTHGYAAFHEITPIVHGKVGKVQRVEGALQPRYASGYLTFGHRNPDLETQLLEWPSGKKDIPDAVAMAVRLLDPASMLRENVEAEPFSTSNNVVPLERAIGGNPWGAP